MMVCQAYCYIVLYVTYVLQHSEIYKTKRLVGTINIECVLRKVSLLCFDFLLMEYSVSNIILSPIRIFVYN